MTTRPEKIYISSYKKCYLVILSFHLRRLRVGLGLGIQQTITIKKFYTFQVFQWYRIGDACA